MTDKYADKVLGGRYEIKEILGIGGMAYVYKAYDRVDDRIVAVKILKDEFLANEEFRLRFKNESKVIAMLSHPNIVKVYDVCFGEDLQYIVMEYVEGITLKEYIERQKVVDWKEALHFVIQILKALQHAHDKGIIHRDIKPQNILLLPNACIKVTDFGIARFSRSEGRSFNDSCAIGSVHYVSPEQARGEQTDARSDIYSVGVVLYEMITGRLPFDSECDESVAEMQVREDAPSLRSINPAIPLGLEQITLKAMQKEPNDRYQSAAEFLLDLDEFKKNPLIDFEYSYFTDRSPTKYINSAAPAIKQGVPVRIADDKSPDDVDDEDEDDTDDDSDRNSTLPILIGVAISLVIIVGIIILIAFADPIKSAISGDNGSSESSQSDSGSFLSKIDVFGLFSKDKIEVPNLVNLTYEEAQEKYPDCIFEQQFIYNTTYDDGKICDQSPAPGKKVSKDTVIVVKVASRGEMVLIKSVKGLNYIEAETVLKSLGFNVVLVPTIDEGSDTQKNTVMYTDPSENTYAANGFTVKVYYASESDGVDSSKVPDVVGDQLSVAKAKITAAGLLVGAVTYESSAASLKDYVIGQSPESYRAVKMGVYVNLVVGNGIPASSTADLSVVLPSLGENAKGSIKLYLNDNAYNIIPDVTLDGSRLPLSFTGSGAENTFKIYIDNSLLYSGEIDFTKSTPEFKNVTAYTYNYKTNVPDVIGKTEEEAKQALSESYFDNVSVTTDYNDTVPAGSVISQTPVSSNLTKYSTAITVSIVISLGPKPNEEPVTTEATTAVINPTAAEQTTQVKPVEPATTPTQPVTTPTQPVTTPTQPATQATEPATQATEPATQATEPATQATEPATQATEPAKQATEPAKQAENNAQQNATPTHAEQSSHASGTSSNGE